MEAAVGSALYAIVDGAIVCSAELSIGDSRAALKH
jgi:hypothetical protein